MNIVNTLTLRHIKTHKKRSILTIMAIIVSVAMVTAVFTSAQSFVVYFQNVAKAIDGDWHSYVHTNNYLDVVDALENDDIQKYGIDMYYAMSDLNDDEKYELTINACDKNYLDLRNIQISEGRAPANDDELLVHKGFLDDNNLKWGIGDKVSIPLEFPNGDVIKKDFKIVGVTNSNVAETDMVEGFIFSTDDLIKSIDDVSVYIKFSKLDKSVYDKTKALDDVLEKGVENRSFGYNTSLLTYSGVTTDDETLKILIGFCSIILLIIAIVSIFMIYDSFAVSYQERAKYLGMLASVGATKRQKRASIYFEGFILGLIGIPLGILAGIGGIWLTFKGIEGVWLETLAIEYDDVLAVSVNWIVILGTVLASAITIFLSSYIPARKASKTTAIDAIKQANTVKVRNAKRLKTSKLATRLLGFEGAMAIKNFKRNSKRSRTIVFALFMSVVVFLSVGNFSLMFNDVMKESFAKNADLKIGVDYKEAEILNSMLEKTDNISSFYGIQYEYADVDKSLLKPSNSASFADSQILVAFVDNATLDAYLNQLGENTAKYHNKNNPTGILHNCAIVRDGNKKKLINPLVDASGKQINVKTPFVSENGANKYIDLTPVVGIQTNEDYKNDLFYFQNLHLPLLVLSIDMAEVYYGDCEGFISKYTAMITSDDPKALEEKLYSALKDSNIETLEIYNATSEMDAINNILTIVKVFVFGFIALITLISIMNIVNTISNSMNERRREFAMIRSVGMTPKGFKKMVYYESIRYGLISLVWSIPISFGIHYVMYYVLSKSYDYGFILHPIMYLIAIVAVFVIISLALVYSVTKIKDDNIIETLKQDIS